MRVGDGMLGRMRGTIQNRQIAIDVASFQVGIGRHRALLPSCTRVTAEQGGQRMLWDCRNRGGGDVLGKLVQRMR